MDTCDKYSIYISMIMNSIFSFYFKLKQMYSYCMKFKVSPL